MKTLSTHPAASINAQGRLISWEKPQIMGILNVTPDSFYDGGQYRSQDQARAKVQEMLTHGVDIIDVGAYSSRPGAPLISVQEELDRAMPILEMIHADFPQATLSIDTFRSEVAQAAVDAGVHIINDVSGGTIDPHMFDTVANCKVPYILMHMRGIPENMQSLTTYSNIVEEVALYFSERIAQLRALGVNDIILDPGFGFAKTIDQNYELLHQVDRLHYLGLPLLGGISRKSMIYKKLGISAEESLVGTTALNTLLLTKGVQILRVHDVKAAKELVDLFF